MRFKVCKTVLIISFYFIGVNQIYAQEVKDKGHDRRIRVGMNYGQASQARFPFDNPYYLYENKYFKAQLNFLLKQKNRFGFEFHFEPSVYRSQHQLLNEYYIQPSDGPDYLIQRELYTQKTKFYEYTLNAGLIARFAIFKPLSTYAIVSIGPMLGEKNTERLRKGFAFSDIFGIGVAYKVARFVIDVRSTLRHNSNAGLFLPNSGHNSKGMEAGISFEL